MKRIPLLTCTVSLIALATACDRQAPVAPRAALPGPSFSARVPADAQDPALAKVLEINAALLAAGSPLAVEELQFFTIGEGRPSIRIHQTGRRFVPDDPRRGAAGANITYLVRDSRGATASALAAAQSGGAIDAALSTWDGSRALKKVTIVKRAESAADPDIFDGFFPAAFHDPGEASAAVFQADIVEAGWRPRAFFETVGGPGGGRGILAFTVSFIFVDAAGHPTDINGDNYLDAAFSEVYYNDNFGNPTGDRAGNPWAIGAPLPRIDVQTVALHENGHALGLGHFGPPPAAVMNPAYVGIRQSPLASDLAGMNTVWASWPNP